MEPIIASVLIVAMVGGVGAWVVVSNRKRKATLAAFEAPLADRGWAFTERWDDAAAGLTVIPFNAGNHRRCEDVIRSGDGAVVSFSYYWTTGSGDNKNRHTRRVTMLRGGPLLPRLEVEADTIVAKIRAAAAGGDHNVELAEFNKAWSVRATDERVSHAVLHPLMIDRFMQPDLWGRSVFFEAGHVGLVDYVVQLENIVTHTDAAVAILREIEALIPNFLRTDSAKDAGPS